MMDVVRAIRHRVGVNRDYDIPYIAGYSRDGNTVFIDRHLPRSFRWLAKTVRVEPFLLIHEIVEKALLDELRENIMKTITFLVGTCALLALPIEVAAAGPCTTEIQSLQAVRRARRRRGTDRRRGLECDRTASPHRSHGRCRFKHGGILHGSRVGTASTSADCGDD
jgi:hypothetical protein